MYQSVPFIRHPLSWYFLGGVVAIAISVVALPIVVWVGYCPFEFGLIKARLGNGDKIEGISSISDLKHQVCNFPDIKEEFQSVCPSFCNTMSNFQEAGEIMQGFGIAGIVLIAIAMFVHILAFRGVQVPKWTINVSIVLPCVAWIVGFIVYCCVADFASVKSANTNYEFDYVQVTKLEIKIGFILAAIESVYLLGLTALGLYSVCLAYPLKSSSMIPLTSA